MPEKDDPVRRLFYGAWVLLACAAGAICIAPQTAAGDNTHNVEIRSAVRYGPQGVEVLDGSGRTLDYRRIALIDEQPYDPEALLPLFQREWESAERTAKPETYIRLGQWCQEAGLDEQAKQAFEKALEIDAESEAARIGLGQARDGETWRDAGLVYETKHAAMQKLGADFGAWLVEAEAKGVALAKRQSGIKDFALQQDKMIVELARWCRTHRLDREENHYLNELVIRTNGWPGDAATWGPRLEIMDRLATKLEFRRSSNPYRAPLVGRWQARVDTNRHHRSNYDMMFAIDFQKIAGKDRLYAGSPNRLSSWHSFGEPVYAIADGEVTWAKDGGPDAAPGQVLKGLNSVMIRHANGETSQYGHLKQGSVTVQKGDRVRAGQMIGRVGNSGQSGTPHLHFSVAADTIEQLRVPDNMGYPQQTIGQSVPFYFEDFRLERVGDSRCDIRVVRGRPQEGWTMVFTEPD